MFVEVLPATKDFPSRLQVASLASEAVSSHVLWFHCSLAPPVVLVFIPHNLSSPTIFFYYFSEIIAFV